ncbi:hypothetical protein [Nocardia sp. NPDC047648]|uniref:hypothetical protein n=1 Tax=Nocardia sp. NPDC047648 TaxID=3155625 RepID=UPI0033D64B9B
MDEGSAPTAHSETGFARGHSLPFGHTEQSPPASGSARRPERTRAGAPRAREIRARLWKHDRPRTATPDTDAPLRVTVREVLDYFAKCPDCGYPAQASATVRELHDGRVETEVRPSCGLPCGWQGRPQISTSPTGPTPARP